MQELKRRINVIRIFPNIASALILISCLCMEYHEEWISARKYLNMEPLYII
ncbi:MAG: transposase [Actinobacteria bacterium]|nr:transposase [Actinomycetota bacterium]